MRDDLPKALRDINAPEYVESKMTMKWNLLFPKHRLSVNQEDQVCCPFGSDVDKGACMKCPWLINACFTEDQQEIICQPPVPD